VWRDYAGTCWHQVEVDEATAVANLIGRLDVGLTRQALRDAGDFRDTRVVPDTLDGRKSLRGDAVR
jgi:hypothetical protein